MDRMMNLIVETTELVHVHRGHSLLTQPITRYEAKEARFQFPWRYVKPTPCLSDVFVTARCGFKFCSSAQHQFRLKSIKNKDDIEVMVRVSRIQWILGQTLSTYTLTLSV
ncbi:hypothetical protein V8G54_028286 [Vigna mungo]|uniref:Uncharacterized protein n=1 Tax=Vigna mungo TaxID=3915 RepID=A0AAQ3MSD9_VIGMU